MTADLADPVMAAARAAEGALDEGASPGQPVAARAALLAASAVLEAAPRAAAARVPPERPRGAPAVDRWLVPAATQAEPVERPRRAGTVGSGRAAERPAAVGLAAGWPVTAGRPVAAAPGGVADLALVVPGAR